MEDLISIIVPVYKVEQFLDNCVQSITRQTYKNLEIILVDDGSPDNCPKICDDLAKKDARIKVVHKPNGGLSSARNAGLNIFTGDFVCFVDSDDFIELDYVKHLHDKQKQTNADLVFCKANRFINGEKIKYAEDLKNIIENYNPENIYKSYCNGTFFLSVWKTLYKRELIKQLSFDEKHKYGEDYSFIVKTSLLTKNIAYIDEYLYNYRFNPNSLTQFKNETDLKNFLHGKDLDGQLMCKLGYTDTDKSMKFDTHILIAFSFKQFADLFTQTKQFNTKENYLAFKKYHNTKKDRLKAFLVYHKMYWLINLIQKARKRGA